MEWRRFDVNPTDRHGGQEHVGLRQGSSDFACSAMVSETLATADAL
jgi:hypothetical protein